MTIVYDRTWTIISYFNLYIMPCLISHFKVIASSFRDSDVLHMQKTVWDKSSRRRKNSPLTRFVSVYVTFLLAYSRVTHVSRAPIIGEKNQHALCLLSRRGASRMNKNSSRTLPYFHTVITTVNSARCKIESRNSKNRSARMRIYMKTKSWGKTRRRIFRTCKFTRERSGIFFCVPTFIKTQTDKLSVWVAEIFIHDSNR